jgi:glycosyltransferase involved in cell wall biosynthesis
MKAPIGSIVVPCYNEELRLNPEYFDSLSKKLNTLGIEIIFVNDGSTDGTLKMIQEFKFNYRIYNLEINHGKAEAIRKALQEVILNSSTSIVGYLDADGAFSTADIEIFVEKFISDPKFKQYQVLSAARVKLAGTTIERKALRHFIGRLISTIINFGNETRIYDPQSGFKLFRASNTLKSALEKPFFTRWFVDLEILNFYTTQRDFIIEVPVSSWIDISGSKIKLIQFPKILLDLIMIKYKYNKRIL